MTALPSPDRFTSGTLVDGRLVLIRKSGSAARCGVLICTGTLVDNGDATVDIELGSE